MKCPLCNNELKYVEPDEIFAKVMDGNDIFQCTTNKYHQFWVNPRDFDNIHWNPESTNDEWDVYLSWKKKDEGDYELHESNHNIVCSVLKLFISIKDDREIMRKDHKKHVEREKDLKEANENIQKAVDTIQFYAEPGTYFAISFMDDKPSGEFMDDFSDTPELGMKPGKMARQFLKDNCYVADDEN